MKYLVTLAAVVLALPAVASPKSHYSSAQLCDLLEPCLPPAQYASGPFRAKPVIVQVPMAQLQVVCNGGTEGTIQAAKEGPDTLGCTEITSTNCVVHMPQGLQARLPQLYRIVLAHELGHCRGWVHED